MVQFVLGMAQLSPVSADGHDHIGAGVSSAHLWHESAAWNVAIGAGFGWIAFRRSRPAGSLPMLTAFVVMLGLLSVNDLRYGGVEAARLFDHAVVVAGFLIVLLLSRREFDLGHPPTSSRPRSAWRARLDDDAPDGASRPAPPLRLLPPPQSARMDPAA